MDGVRKKKKDDHSNVNSDQMKKQSVEQTVNGVPTQFLLEQQLNSSLPANSPQQFHSKDSRFIAPPMFSPAVSSRDLLFDTIAANEATQPNSKQNIVTPDWGPRVAALKKEQSIELKHQLAAGATTPSSPSVVAGTGGLTTSQSTPNGGGDIQGGGGAAIPNRLELIAMMKEAEGGVISTKEIRIFSPKETIVGGSSGYIASAVTPGGSINRVGNNSNSALVETKPPKLAFRFETRSKRQSSFRIKSLSQHQQDIQELSKQEQQQQEKQPNVYTQSQQSIEQVQSTKKNPPTSGFKSLQGSPARALPSYSNNPLKLEKAGKEELSFVKFDLLQMIQSNMKGSNNNNNSRNLNQSGMGFGNRIKKTNSKRFSQESTFQQQSLLHRTLQSDWRGNFTGGGSNNVGEIGSVNFLDGSTIDLFGNSQHFTTLNSSPEKLNGGAIVNSVSATNLLAAEKKVAEIKDKLRCDTDLLALIKSSSCSIGNNASVSSGNSQSIIEQTAMAAIAGSTTIPIYQHTHAVKTHTFNNYYNPNSNVSGTSMPVGTSNTSSRSSLISRTVKRSSANNLTTHSSATKQRLLLDVSAATGGESLPTLEAQSTAVFAQGMVEVLPQQQQQQQQQPLQSQYIQQLNNYDNSFDDYNLSPISRKASVQYTYNTFGDFQSLAYIEKQTEQQASFEQNNSNLDMSVHSIDAAQPINYQQQQQQQPHPSVPAYPLAHNFNSHFAHSNSANSTQASPGNAGTPTVQGHGYAHHFSMPPSMPIANNNQGTPQSQSVNSPQNQQTEDWGNQNGHIAGGNSGFAGQLSSARRSMKRQSSVRFMLPPNNLEKIRERDEKEEGLLENSTAIDSSIKKEVFMQENTQKPIVIPSLFQIAKGNIAGDMNFKNSNQYGSPKQSTQQQQLQQQLWRSDSPSNTPKGPGSACSISVHFQSDELIQQGSTATPRANNNLNVASLASIAQQKLPSRVKSGSIGQLASARQSESRVSIESDIDDDDDDSDEQASVDSRSIATAINRMSELSPADQQRRSGGPFKPRTSIFFLKSLKSNEKNNGEEASDGNGGSPKDQNNQSRENCSSRSSNSNSMNGSRSNQGQQQQYSQNTIKEGGDDKGARKKKQKKKKDVTEEKQTTEKKKKNSNSHVPIALQSEENIPFSSETKLLGVGSVVQQPQQQYSQNQHYQHPHPFAQSSIYQSQNHRGSNERNWPRSSINIENNNSIAIGSPSNQQARLNTSVMINNPMNTSIMNNNSYIAYFSKGPDQSVIETSQVKREIDDEGKKKINNYTMVRELGRGGFGKVKLARSENEPWMTAEGNRVTEFAIKISNKKALKRKLVSMKVNAYSLLEREVATMKKIEHPHLVKLYEVINDPDDEKIYMVMEYMQKGAIMSSIYWKKELLETNPSLYAMIYENQEDLKASMHSKQKKDLMNEHIPKHLPMEKCRKYFQQFALAIDYMHNYAQVIHRDIKPENILINDEDNLKIGDFGVSHIMETNEDTDMHQNAGTKAFTAPEGWSKTFKGKPLDMWATGVTLFYIAFGSLPFFSKDQITLRNMIVNDEVVVPEGTDELLRDLIFKLLVKNPDERLTASQMLSHPWLTMNGEITLQNSQQSEIKVSDQDISSAFTPKIHFSTLMKVKVRLSRQLTRARSFLHAAMDSSRDQIQQDS